MRPEFLRAPKTAKGMSLQPNYTVADEMAAAFKRHGITSVFGQSIPSAFILALADLGIRQIVYRTENAGAAMADGFARISNTIGVVTAQNGPAATLLVPGLAEALKSSIPILAIVQDVSRPTVDRNAFQELDHLSLFTGSAKWIRRVERRDRVSDILDQAVVAATTGRPGPVVLVVPMDLLVEETQPNSSRRMALATFPLDRLLPPAELVNEAAKLILEAENPVVISGGGIHISGAHDELSALQDLASLPLGTTLMGKGAVDENHPLSIGVTGNSTGKRGRARYCRDLIKTADLVVLAATRTAQNGTDSWSMYAPGTKFIHIDIDGNEIGRNYEALRLVGDAKLTLAALNAAITAMDLTKRSQKRPGLEQEIAQARKRHLQEASDVTGSDQSPIRPERIMSDVQKLLTPETIVTADASYSSIWVTNYLVTQKPGTRFLTPRGLAGLGWGLPLAMGAKVARPDAPVLAYAGDGGFGHVWSELETAVREKINVVLTVFNNQILGFQKDAEDERHGRHTDACYFSSVDHAKVAEAAGCKGVRVERAGDYGDAVAEALRRDGPTLIDVVTDPDAYPPLGVFDDRVDAVRARRAELQKNEV
ncbi:acetolactate synthase catalytic subunit [Rhizobium sp. Leaf386]|uniref:acetolactate synthase catalytic subunit n=1 Tax=Rhizobium sp. Leaf386 TaxID=1736359 RepID=UPI000AD9B5D6|nr:acetolactate synthase catalytic subunit [Rhizobium sp. Leaf386]